MHETKGNNECFEQNCIHIRRIVFTTFALKLNSYRQLIDVIIIIFIFPYQIIAARCHRKFVEIEGEQPRAPRRWQTQWTNERNKNRTAGECDPCSYGEGGTRPPPTSQAIIFRKFQICMLSLCDWKSFCRRLNMENGRLSQSAAQENTGTQIELIIQSLKTFFLVLRFFFAISSSTSTILLHVHGQSCYIIARTDLKVSFFSNFVHFQPYLVYLMHQSNGSLFHSPHSSRHHRIHLHYYFYCGCRKFRRSFGINIQSNQKHIKSRGRKKLVSENCNYHVKNCPIQLVRFNCVRVLPHICPIAGVCQISRKRFL